MGVAVDTFLTRRRQGTMYRTPTLCTLKGPSVLVVSTDAVPLKRCSYDAGGFPYVEYAA